MNPSAQYKVVATNAMKKILMPFIVVAVLAGCGEKQEKVAKETPATQAKVAIFDATSEKPVAQQAVEKLTAFGVSIGDDYRAIQGKIVCNNKSFPADNDEKYGFQIVCENHKFNGQNGRIIYNFSHNRKLFSVFTNIEYEYDISQAENAFLNNYDKPAIDTESIRRDGKWSREYCWGECELHDNGPNEYWSVNKAIWCKNKLPCLILKVYSVNEQGIEVSLKDDRAREEDMAYWINEKNKDPAYRAEVEASKKMAEEEDRRYKAACDSLYVGKTLKKKQGSMLGTEELVLEIIGVDKDSGKVSVKVVKDLSGLYLNDRAEVSCETLKKQSY